MSDLTRVSLSLDQSLLDSLEQQVAKKGYENRSEFIRDLIRDHLARDQWLSGEEVLGTLTLIYNHHQRGVSEKLVEEQHHSGEHILASTHVHLSHEICAEMIMLRGSGSGIIKLTNALKQLRGVLHASLAMSTTGKDIS
jgi:CopG family nickel-responsive transcriptional regulator